MKDKLLCAVGGATSVLTVGFLAAILAIVGYMPDLPKTNVDGQCLKLIDSDELSCGPEQLLKFTIEKNELFYKELKGKYDGGDKTDKGMLSETCEKEHGEESELKHVAKMVGLDMSRTTKQGEGHTHRVFWDTSSADNIVQGVEYNNGCFKIKRTGHYFLYSQVKLSRNQDQAMLPTNGPFSLSMHRYRNTKETLLESSNSKCDISSSEDMTSSIGAVFELEEGDAICVETSHPQNLVNSRESNNFGLYSISSRS